MSDIYYGRVEHPWAIELESWPEQPVQEMQRLESYKESINQHVAILGWPADASDEHNAISPSNTKND